MSHAGSFFPYLRRLLLAEALVVGTVFLICWLGGWLSPADLGDGLTIAGILILTMNLYDNHGGVEKSSGRTSKPSRVEAPARNGPVRRTFLLEILPLGLATLTAGIALATLA